MERIILLLSLTLFGLSSCGNKELDLVNLSDVKQFFIKDSLIYGVRVKGWRETSSIILFQNQQYIETMGYNPHNTPTSILTNIKSDNLFIFNGKNEKHKIDTSVSKVNNLYFKIVPVKMEYKNIEPIIFDHSEVDSNQVFFYRNENLLNKVSINNVIFTPSNESDLIKIFHHKKCAFEIYIYKQKKEEIDRLKQNILEQLFKL